MGPFLLRRLAMCPGHYLRSVTGCARTIHGLAEEAGDNITGHPKEVDFTNYADAYCGESTWSVLSSWFILRLCRFSFLVDRAEDLIQSSQKVFGMRFTDTILKKTFFQHFCAGENIQEAMMKLEHLSKHGVEGLLDCGALIPPRNSTPSILGAILEANMKSIEGSIVDAGLTLNAKRVAIKPTTLVDLDALERFTSFVGVLKQNGTFPQGLCFVEIFEQLMIMAKRDMMDAKLIEEKDIEQMQNFRKRLQSLGNLCVKNQVRMMMDAEESEFQEAVDLTVLAVMEEFNQSECHIWTTYQCYLKNLDSRLSHDLDAFSSQGKYFGVKLVRGAYINHETNRALQQNRKPPILETKLETDEAYNQNARFLLEKMHQGEKIELCLATHNQQSIEEATNLMKRLKLDQRTTPVYFATLTGMADYLAFTLGHHHYNTIKLLVYGNLHNILPYLIRRAQENGDVLGGSQKDITALQTFLTSQWMPPLGKSTLNQHRP